MSRPAFFLVVLLMATSSALVCLFFGWLLGVALTPGAAVTLTLFSLSSGWGYASLLNAIPQDEQYQETKGKSCV